MNTSIHGKEYANATSAFESLFTNILHTGEDYACTKAAFNVSFVLQNPIDKVVTTTQRKFKQDYAEYEWEWYIKGDRDAKEISERAKIWKQMMIPGTTEVNSNYGYFWNYNNQLLRVIDELKTNKQTRRAILVHYLLHELDRYKYDTPCNDVLNFYIKDDKLNMTVFARSIDLVYGFCNDQYTFAKLMEYVSEKTGYEIGQMHWFVTNLHIYQRHFDLMKK
jgi:thymidylate synthase